MADIYMQIDGIKERVPIRNTRTGLSFFRSIIPYRSRLPRRRIPLAAEPLGAANIRTTR